MESIESNNSQPKIPVSAAETKSDGHAVASSFELHADTAAGDLRDAIWQVLRDHAVLNKIDERRQKNLALGIFDVCRKGVRATAHHIIAAGFSTIEVELDTVSFKPKGVEAKLTFLSAPRQIRRDLVDAQGSNIALVVANVEAYLRARGEVAIDRDQPDLPIDDKDPAAPEPQAGEAGAEGVDSEVNGAGDDPERATLGERIANLAAEGRPLAAGIGPAFAEARRIGREDGERGDRDHAAHYAAGTPGHADYELGHNEGREIREAREQEWAIKAAQAVQIHTTHPQEPPPRRRGRPRKEQHTVSQP